VLVDHELVAALEQGEERDRAVGSDDFDRPVDSTIGSRRRAAAMASPSRVWAFSRTRSSSRAVCQVATLTMGGRPGSAVVGSFGVVVTVSSVVSDAGGVAQPCGDGHLGRRATLPELIAAGTPLAGPDHVAGTT
jgi:hypothetical protein